MKAMVLRAPGDVGFEDIDRPKPRSGEVLVRVSHSGICGTDLKIYDASVPVSHPLIMGHEMSGEVVEFGANGIPRDRIRIGDRVIIDPCLYCGVCVNCRE